MHQTTAKQAWLALLSSTMQNGSGYQHTCFSREKREAKTPATNLNDDKKKFISGDVPTNHTNRRCSASRAEFEVKMCPHLPLSPWSVARRASRSERGTASTGRCHLSGGRPPHQCSLTAWPGWCLCRVLWRLPAPGQPAGPRSSWCRPGRMYRMERIRFDYLIRDL